LERLRALIPTTVVALHSSASPYLPTDNKYKNINKLNIYENTYELNDSLKPHDIFFTPHLLTLDDVLYTTPSLTLKDVFYWEFKAG
jgi:hypothetical protein